MDEIRIAATVILYKPNKSVLSNIKTYLDKTSALFVIDNSEEPVEFIKEEFLTQKNVKYISNNGNLGIAAALNIACKMALEEGYDWLLTMDQDSSFKKEMLEEFFDQFYKNENKDSTAIFSPQQNMHEYLMWKALNQASNENECEAVMTSGNLLNLEIYQKIGGFEEKLFIDEVDHDYCLSAIVNNFKIIKFCNIYLKHQLGKDIVVKKKGSAFTLADHSPLRMYYITRNNFYIWNKYKKALPNYIKARKRQFFADNIYNLLRYKSKKIKKLTYMLKGFLDYKNNKFGKYGAKNFGE